MIDGFEALVQSLQGEVAEAIVPAFEVRMSSPVIDQLRVYEAEFDGSDLAVLVEAIDLDSGLSGFIMIIKDSQSVKLRANREVMVNAGVYQVSEPDVLRELILSQSQVGQFDSLLSSMQFAEGAGSNKGTYGGDTYFITLKRGRTFTRAILHGYGHAIITPYADIATDPDDLTRQKAIDGIYEFWSDVETAVVKQPSRVRP